ncbi:MAG: YbhB/YbcL family Raf kinase inhibitor-like protein [Crocinitomicaceae bacterium]
MKKINLIFLIQVIVFNSVYAQNTFTLSSNELGGQATINEEFNGFGCMGDNLSPQLSWQNAPEGTNSFAITMYDPDAPTGSGWWHWVVFDIPLGTNEIVSGAGSTNLNLMPRGVIQSVSDYGTNGYGGPCPPEGHGLHQYIITIHALSIAKLGLNPNTNPAVVGYNILSNTLSKASIVIYYERVNKAEE